MDPKTPKRSTIESTLVFMQRKHVLDLGANTVVRDHHEREIHTPFGTIIAHPL